MPNTPLVDPALAPTAAPPQRHWYASLALSLGLRAGKTRLLSAAHQGPLRVQRAFYPEGAHCHLYWLHPPGGLVTGDELSLSADLLPGAQVLLTTPSAGKIYAVDGVDAAAATRPLAAAARPQLSRYTLNQAEDSYLEWLPQETLVFNGADARIRTRFNLAANARLFAWDLLCLGRPASNHGFNTGRCHSGFELWQDGRPLQIERTDLLAGDKLFGAPWGLQGAHTLGTCLATLSLPRDEQEDLLAALTAQFGGADNIWGLTQKGPLLLVRYLGRDMAVAKAGCVFIWQHLRPKLINRPACLPRIWAT